jgi:hypothetical protein
MKQKRKSPTTLAGDTGNNLRSKNTKKTRIKYCKLVCSWKNPSNVKCMERIGL